MKRLVRLTAFSLLWLPALCLALDTDLQIEADGRLRRFSLETLRLSVPSREVEVVSPDLGRPVRYLTLPLGQVLRVAGITTAEDLVFHCLDGYKSNTPFTNIQALDLLLAYGEDGEAGKWTPIQAGKTENNPAPYIVISAKSSDPKVFSWPYQMNRIEVVSFSARFPKTIPPGVKSDSAVGRGFATFRQQCLKCHSINLQGGEVGPELNLPRNITEYRSQSFLRRWIHNPSDYRARARMPALGLSSREIDDILAYLRHMRRHKQP